MTRRLAIIALAFALLVQAGFIATFHWQTNGALFYFSGSPSPRPLTDSVSWLLSISSLPLGRLSVPASFPLPGASYELETWAGLIVYAGVNAFFWFDVIFFFLIALVMLLRVRIGTRPGARRIYLAERSEVRPWALAAIPLALLGVGMMSGAVHRRGWKAEAERVLHASIESVRTDGEDPRGVNVSLIVDRNSFAPAQLAGRYVLEARRTGPRAIFADRFVPPRSWRGVARFPTGSPYEFAVYRTDGMWEVDLYGPLGP